MRDLVIRLASMKLAEMKFDVSIVKDLNRFARVEETSKKMTLKEIKSMLKNLVKNPGAFWHEDEATSFSFGAYPPSDNTNIDYIEIGIECPIGMKLENFRQIIKALKLQVVVYGR